MQIKTQLGKLRLTSPLAELIAKQQETNEVETLPVSLNHVLALEHLPVHHRDPFDRLLIAQAVEEKLMLVSKDKALQAYPVKLFW